MYYIKTRAEIYKNLYSDYVNISASLHPNLSDDRISRDGNKYAIENVEKYYQAASNRRKHPLLTNQQRVKLTAIEKEYVEGQTSYKDAIKHYALYHLIYKGVRMSDVIDEHKSAVSKISTPIKQLQHKSNEVRQILKWINLYKKGIDISISYACDKSIKRTIKSIKKEIGLE